MAGVDTAIAATQDRRNGSGPSPLNEASKIKSTLEHTLEPFPEPRHTIKGDLSYYHQVRRWLGLAALQRLREDESTCIEELSLHLENLVMDLGERWLDHKPGKNRIGFFDVEGLAQSAAEWALETYRPSYRRRFTRADAAKGGRASKRPSKLFERYRELPSNLSITEAAKTLGCHPRTVSRLRLMVVAERDRADQIILDELDELIARRNPQLMVPEPQGTQSMRTLLTEHAADTEPGRAVSNDPKRNHETMTSPEELPIDEMWASIGLMRMSDGSLYFPDPEPLSLADGLIL